MARGINRLSTTQLDAFVRKARAGKAKTKKLSDGHGLYITVTPAGTPVWRIKYRLGGKEQVYSVGIYPGDVPLELARNERDTVRRLVKEGRDPVKARQLSRAERGTARDNTFAGTFEDWLAKQRWVSTHREKSRRRFETDVLPYLGRLPIEDITTPMIARVIERIVARGANETAERVLRHIRAVFELAQTRTDSRLPENPATAARAVLRKRKEAVPRAALLDVEALRDVLVRAQRADLSPAVHQAHRLAAFTGARIGNIVEARWEDFSLDGETPTWTIPREKMKSKHAHRPPHKILLGPTIAAELTAWRDAGTRKGYVFPSPTGSGEPISRESLEKSYRDTLGLAKTHTVHGWRASLSTLAKDAGFGRDVVELTLDHVHDSEVVRAYDRGERLIERKKLIAWWDLQLQPPMSNPTALQFRTGAA
jgi:integrase